MKSEKDKFDDFLRSTLGNYQAEPSPAVWESLQNKLPEKPAGFLAFWRKGFGILLMSIVIITVSTLVATRFLRTEKTGMVHYVQINQPDIHRPANGNTALVSENIPTKNNPKTISVVHAISSPKQETPTQLSASEQKPAAYANQTIHELPSNQTTTPKPLNPASPLVPANSVADVLVSRTNQTLPSLPQLIAMTSLKSHAVLDLITPNGNISSDLRNYDVNEIMNLLLSGQPRNIDYAPKPFELSAGIWFAPEWLTSGDKNYFGENRFSQGIRVSLKQKPLLLETGISYVKEEGNRQFDYRYRQLLGTYGDLQSVTFTWDSILNQPVPHYNYNNITVFDTAVNSMPLQSDAQYTYLQIPIVAGYYFEIGRHTFAVKGGAMISILTKKDEKIPYINDPEKLTTGLFENNPTRANTTWLWTLAASYGLKMGDHINLLLEPHLQGYLSSPFEQKKALPSKPTYFGVKAGLEWEF